MLVRAQSRGEEVIPGSLDALVQELRRVRLHAAQRGIAQEALRKQAALRALDPFQPTTRGLFLALWGEFEHVIAEPGCTRCHGVGGLDAGWMSTLPVPCDVCWVNFDKEQSNESTREDQND